MTSNRRITLVQPPFDPHWTLPPLGLACLAGALAEDEYDVSIVDLNLDCLLQLQEMTKVIVRTQPEIVGLTVWGDMAPVSMELGRQLKNIDPTLKVLLGGEFATFNYQSMLEAECADAVVLGEGEVSIRELCKHIFEGKPLGKVRGIAYKNEREQVVLTGKRPIACLNDLPSPAWDLFELKRYKRFKDDRVLPLQGSRGCIYRCIFCSVWETWRTYRTKNPSNLIAEIKSLVDRFGVERIHFCDDNFTLNRRWVLRVCELLSKSNYSVSWNTMTRADLVDSRILQSMRKVGCDVLFYGIESVSPRILRLIGNKPNREISQYAIDLALEAGIDVEISVIFGFPKETRKEMFQTRNFCLLNLRKEGVSHVHPHVLFPLPGTLIVEKYLDTIIRNPYPKLTQPSLTSIPAWIFELMEANQPMVPDFWMFRTNMQLEPFFRFLCELKLEILLSKEKTEH